MSVRSLLFLGLVGAGAVALATANVGLLVSCVLTDGGTVIGPGTDGGPIGGADGGPIGGTDGGPIGGDDGGATLGSIAMTVNCVAGTTCDQTGNLVVTVKDCTSQSVVKGPETHSGVTLSQATPPTITITDVPQGNYCVNVFLDKDSSGAQNTGDLIAAADAQVAVTGPNSPGSITLDRVAP